MGGFKVETWIDSSHVVYPNIRVLSGGAVSFGWGIVDGKYTNQKVNTKIMTKLEVVVMSE